MKNAQRIDAYLRSSLCYSQEECDQMTLSQKETLIKNDGRGYLLTQWADEEALNQKLGV